MLREHAERELGADAGDGDELVEQVELVVGGEADQGELVFAHDEVGVEQDGLARGCAEASSGCGTRTRKPTPPTMTISASLSRA